MKNLQQRWTSKTPKWFVKIIRVGLTLSGVGLALLGAEAQIEGFELPELLHDAAQWFVLMGLVAAAVAKSATENE